MKISSILIMKVSSLGDILQSMQAVLPIRRRFPQCRMDWVVEKSFADLLYACPWVDRVIVCDWKKWRKKRWSKGSWTEFKNFAKELREIKYDLLIDFQGTLKTSLFNSLVSARQKCGFGPLSVPEWPNLLTTRYHYEVDKKQPMILQYRSLIKQIFGLDIPAKEDSICLLRLQREEEARLRQMVNLEGRQNKCIMVCFGSNWENKKLDKDVLLHLLRQIREKDPNAFFFFVWKSKQEKEEADWHVSQWKKNSKSVGDLTVPLWQALMRKMHAVISMDSSSLHLAAAAGVPTFSFFGPSHGKIYNPAGNRHGYLQGTCPYGVAFEKRCPFLRSCSTGACIKGLQKETAVSHFFSWWNTAFSSSSKSM
ncbi:MAG: hypothetical protein Tsb0015_11960 [Simkaniaceae bacterium]